MRVAIQGCGHGTLNAIYASVSQACKAKRWDKVDLLIIGGDFQAARNAYDLNCMSIPPKYRQIGDFHEYYSGKRKAPYLTIFVGGNHEASAYSKELHYGGWVAQNIYYLGVANVIWVNNLRIAGLGGIWSWHHYNLPHSETLPFSNGEIKSVYHVREIDVRKLLLLKRQVDVALGHDWPRGIEWKGDSNQLFQLKPFFRKEAERRELGNPAATQVMDRLRPRYWFSAHLHVKFAAIAKYRPTDASIARYSKEEDGSYALAEEFSRDRDVTEKHIRGQTSVHAKDEHNTSAPENPNEITLDDEEQATTVEPQNAQPVLVHNTDEIDLDMDDDVDETVDRPADTSSATSTHVNGTFNANNVDKLETNGMSHDDTLEKTSIPDEVRAQLPASFTRAKETVKPEGIEIAPVAVMKPPSEVFNTETKFLALDKCLPKRDFLSLQKLEPISRVQPEVSSSKLPESKETGPRLRYDAEWLSILRVFKDHNPNREVPPNLGEEVYDDKIAAERKWVDEHLVQGGRMDVPRNFRPEVEPYDKRLTHSIGEKQPAMIRNSQTRAFCEMLQIPDFITEDPNDEERKREYKEKGERIRAAHERYGVVGGRPRGVRGGRGHGRGRGRGSRRG